MTTEIFKDYKAFINRNLIDKDVNGVSPEFAEKNPNYINDNATNKGCWECVGCTHCTACYQCNYCQDCTACVGCSDLLGCRGEQDLTTPPKMRVPPIASSRPEPLPHPSYYNQHPIGLNSIRIVEEFTYNVGTAMSYLWRAHLKGEQISDLKKAINHIQFEIERLER